jgi:hypothetical protein
MLSGSLTTRVSFSATPWLSPPYSPLARGREKIRLHLDQFPSSSDPSQIRPSAPARIDCSNDENKEVCNGSVTRPSKANLTVRTLICLIHLSRNDTDFWKWDLDAQTTEQAIKSYIEKGERNTPTYPPSSHRTGKNGRHPPTGQGLHRLGEVQG